MTKPVPPLARNERALNRQQADFYKRWLNAWQRGEVLDIEGQYQYVWNYLTSLVLKPPYKELLQELRRLKHAYSSAEDDTLLTYIDMWSADCHILLGRYNDAISVLPELQINVRSSAITDNLLSLKLATGQRLSGKDAITLFGPQLTAFGRKHVALVSEYLEVLIRGYEQENGVNLLNEWSQTSYAYKYPVFIGSPYGYDATQKHRLTSYSFSRNEEVKTFVKTLTRDAENTVREELNIPHVGQGWISETELYYAIKNALPEYKVFHHGAPEWLGRQHLDIYIPEVGLAIEYQGRQHDEPIAFFGGEEAFTQNQKRDARKRRLCTDNGVKVVYVRPGYILENVLDDIRNYVRQGF